MISVVIHRALIEVYLRKELAVAFRSRGFLRRLSFGGSRSLICVLQQTFDSVERNQVNSRRIRIGRHSHRRNRSLVQPDINIMNWDDHTLVGGRAFDLGLKGSSSSDGVGKTLSGFVELFLEARAGVFAGVAVAVPAVDFRLRGDVRTSSSYNITTF